MSRRNIRKLIVQWLYSEEFHRDPQALPLALKKLSAEDQKRILQKAENLQKKRDDLDEIISKHAKNWRIERMSLIDLNIMRLAIFEIRFCDDIPDKVALNEALELAKTYSDKDSPSFINGILDKVLTEKQ